MTAVDAVSLTAFADVVALLLRTFFRRPRDSGPTHVRLCPKCGEIGVFTRGGWAVHRWSCHR
jgi:hypothetical protein